MGKTAAVTGRGYQLEPVGFDSRRAILGYEPSAEGIGPSMRLLKASFLLLALAMLCGQGAPPFGPVGPEGSPDREQRWEVPTPVAGRNAQAMLFRPPGDGPFRLAVIAHATTQNELRRAQMPQPEYRALAAFLVARGFAVLVPERLGHGATGGAYLEDQHGCDAADYLSSGRATAEQIRLALEFVRSQPFIRRDGAVIIGHSAGGWGALALSGEDARAVSAIILFAPGRGGHADDAGNSICAPDRLIATAATFGHGARVPMTWLVAANDTYFSPGFSRKLFDAFRSGGGKGELHVLPAFSSEGHWLAENEDGVTLAAAELDRALKAGAPAAVKR
jgi:dienelactone hydrolase